jgi:hypothetical protein
MGVSGREQHGSKKPADVSGKERFLKEFRTDTLFSEAEMRKRAQILARSFNDDSTHSTKQNKLEKKK